MGVGDGTGASEARSLHEIARTLDDAACEVRRHARARAEPADASAPPPDARPPTAAQVRALIAARRLRLAYLPDLHGDHGFAMLLELYAANLEGRRIAQTRLGSLAGAPQATAIRIVAALVEAGLVDRVDDPADRRLILLGLTPDAAARMRDYLSRAFAANVLLL